VNHASKNTRPLNRCVRIDTEMAADKLNFEPGAFGAEAKTAEDTDETADSNGSTPGLKDLETGTRHTVEVTLAERLEPKPWQQGRGHIVDDGEIMKYVAEGDNPLADVDEGDRVRISQAKVATDEYGAKQLEISGVCDVQRLREAGTEQSPIDDTAQVEADGGQAETDTPVPDDAEGAAADARRLAKWVDDAKQELPEAEIVGIATKRLEDTDPDRARTLIDKATSEGLLTETSDGYKGNL
jgi:hypothetical protein